MANQTASILALATMTLAVSSCQNAHVKTLALRSHIHELWNQQEFHQIYAASTMGDQPGQPEDRVVNAWARERRLVGNFEKDLGDTPLDESQTSYDGYKIVQQLFSTRYSSYPVAESIFWKVRGDDVRFMTYTRVPNAEVRCERGLFSTQCRVVVLGPVPPSR